MRWSATLAVVSLGVSGALLLWPEPDPGEVVEHAVDAVERPPPVGTSPRGDEPPSGSPRRGTNPVWRVIDEESVTVTPPYAHSWSEAGRVLVDVRATSRAYAWQVGDRLSVELPGLGGIRDWTVERIDEGRDARSRSVRGWLENGDGPRRRIVVTVGPGRVLAYIDTRHGPYELTGNDRLAWLLPSSSMMAGVDFSKPDYWLRERGERPRDGR